MPEVWKPTNWAVVDATIEFELLQLIRQGYLRPRPADDDPTAYVWDYPYDDEGYAIPECVDSQGPFVDEVFDLYRNGYIHFEQGNIPRLLPAGEEYLNKLLENPPPSYASTLKASELPDYIREEFLRAIKVLDAFGGIDEARADHPRLAEALRRIAWDRWSTAFDRDEWLLEAIPALLHDALKTEEA